MDNTIPPVDLNILAALLAEIRDALAKPRLEDRLGLSVEEVAELTGVGKTALWSSVSAGEFPRPAHIGGRSVFSASAVRKWFEEQSRKPWKPRRKRAG